MAPDPGGPRARAEAGGRNLLLVRTGITFALLASVVTVHFSEPELLLSGGFRHLYVALVVSYGWLLLRYAAWETRDLPFGAAVLQALVDVGFISLIVFATGLADSVFSFMYVIVILLGSLEAYMKGAMLWAALASCAYAGMLVLQAGHVLVPPGAASGTLTLRDVVRPAVIHTAGFMLTGVLSGLLGEDIRRTRQRMQDREIDLRKLELFNKYVVDNIPSGILTADMQGRVSLINDTACRILGIARRDAAGRPVREVLTGIDFDRPAPDPPVPRPEVAFRRADGVEIFLGFSASPLRDERGQVIGTVVIFQDLTPVKRMEERIRLADRLATVGELAAGLAHEIRNPMASIAGSSQMLRESPEISEESRTLLAIIERESTRLNGLISDFLSFSGTSLRDPGPVHLGDVVTQVAEAVRAGEAREKGVEVEGPPQTDLVVEGDAEQIKQVVWNLVRNGIQATAAGGRVALDLFPQIRHGERHAVITVTDTGAGIDPRIVGKIFNPFFTTKEGGTGLGLAISQKIVHFHRGFIEVRSTPGSGSTFSVFLPVKCEAARANGSA